LRIDHDRKKDFNKLIDDIPMFRQFHEKLKAKSVDTFQNRIMSNISDTAEESISVSSIPTRISSIALLCI
jgi:hypothetical protein